MSWMRVGALALMVVVGLTAFVEMPVTDAALRNGWYVTASSGLRVRDMSGAPVDRVRFGKPLGASDLMPTGRREVIEGLPGEWVSFWMDGERVQVFDAFLWCTPPPSEDDNWEQYCQRNLDYDTLSEFERCELSVAAVAFSGTSTAVFKGVTVGQAHQFYRMLIQQRYASDYDRMDYDTRAEWDQIFKRRWDPSRPLSFDVMGEAGEEGWELEYDTRSSTAKLIHRAYAD